jgi:hypothetical protein
MNGKYYDRSGLRQAFCPLPQASREDFFQDDIHRRSVTDKHKGIFSNMGDETPGSYLHLSDG